MADPKTTLDDAADTANSWWAWAVSFVPAKWKRYVVLVILALGLVWLAPAVVGVLKDTMGYLFVSQTAETKDFEAKVHDALMAHGGAIVELRQRVNALESKSPPITTGSTNVRPRR